MPFYNRHILYREYSAQNTRTWRNVLITCIYYFEKRFIPKHVTQMELILKQTLL